MGYCADGTGEVVLSGHHGFDTLRYLEEKDVYEVGLYSYDENTDETTLTLDYQGNYNDDCSSFLSDLCDECEYEQPDSILLP